MPKLSSFIGYVAFNRDAKGALYLSTPYDGFVRCYPKPDGSLLMFGKNVEQTVRGLDELVVGSISLKPVRLIARVFFEAHVLHIHDDCGRTSNTVLRLLPMHGMVRTVSFQACFWRGALHDGHFPLQPNGVPVARIAFKGWLKDPANPGRSLYCTMHCAYGVLCDTPVAPAVCLYVQQDRLKLYGVGHFQAGKPVCCHAKMDAYKKLEHSISV